MVVGYLNLPQLGIIQSSADPMISLWK